MSTLGRRRFLLASTAGAGFAEAAMPGVSLVVDPADPVAAPAPCRWAAEELRDALAAARVSVNRAENLAQARPGDFTVVLAGFDGARNLLSGVRLTASAEATLLAPIRVNARPGLVVAGADMRGLLYATLDTADRVRHAADPLAALLVANLAAERPANRVRAISRLFSSEVEDKPWFNDREMWPRYFAMLAANRFNRFHLALGIGYDFLRQVTDAYFLFPYPFLLDVPGYRVRVPQLAAAERDRNLEMLRYIGEQCAAHGLDFQLGLWMHGYRWIDSPSPNYTIEGLTEETHGPYCRDALRLLLQACPSIGGVTLRVHGESGVEEGSFEFWKMVFEGVAACGRKVELDMHAKGMNQTMLDLALSTGLPVRVSPKYWAEHMGMPYHQAEIREIERPKPGKEATGLMKFSSGSRSFLRYGYGDLLRTDRKWSVIHRIWPGTQRLLLWGDPVTAAAHSRAFRFCGSDGVDIMEPLSFKGRRGSGIAGDRCGYADAALRTRWDWEKYAYQYRIWGRLLYAPNGDPDVWRRSLRKSFGEAAPAVEAALASASRILPAVTTAHGPSAANNGYWPEMYTNQPLADGAHPDPYRDTLPPRVFANTSPFDPQLFSRMNEFAAELAGGRRSGKYSPVEVAQYLEDRAEAASGQLALAEARAAQKDAPVFRRLAVDVSIQAGLGRFFGAKFRAGVLYALFERTGDGAALTAAVERYRAARDAWATLAERAKGVYLPDVTVGELPQLRGHWLDRLPAIDRDIAALAKKLEEAKPGEPDPKVAAAIAEILGRPRRPAVACRHVPPRNVRRGQAVEIEITFEKAPESVELFYRHVNQGERWETLALEPGLRCRAAIPPAYTDSAYPLEYYFALDGGIRAATLHPGFSPDFTGQPYFVVG